MGGVIASVMKIEIGEFGNVHLIKVDEPLTEERVRQLPEVVELLNGRDASFKLDAHGLWIVKLRPDE